MKTEEFKYPGEPSDEEFLREIDAETRAFMARMTALSPETRELAATGNAVVENRLNSISPFQRKSLDQFNQATELTKRIAATSDELKLTDSISRKADLSDQIDKLRGQIADLKGPYGKQQLENARRESIVAKKKLWRARYEEEEAQRIAAERALAEKIERRAKVIQETAPTQTQFKSESKTLANPGASLP